MRQESKDPILKFLIIKMISVMISRVIHKEIITIIRIMLSRNKALKDWFKNKGFKIIRAI